MRWFWIDRFVEFESGRRAVALKNVALAEEHLLDHFPGYPVMPHSLCVEGMAQTGGLLVGQSSDFQARVVLAKLGKVTFHGHATPGDTLKYTAVVEDIREDGALVSTTSHRNGELHAEASIVFAHLDDDDTTRQLFLPHEFFGTLRALGVFDIGVNPDGTPIKPPQYMLDAERAFINPGK